MVFFLVWISNWNERHIFHSYEFEWFVHWQIELMYLNAINLLVIDLVYKLLELIVIVFFSVCYFFRRHCFCFHYLFAINSDFFFISSLNALCSVSIQLNFWLIILHQLRGEQEWERTERQAVKTICCYWFTRYAIRLFLRSVLLLFFFLLHLIV